MLGESGADLQPPAPPPTPPGVVELREDVPLAGRARGAACGAGGPRLVGGCFAALSVGVAVALLAQVYRGEREVAPHGSVATSAAACSRAGTDALQAGGRALDAAAAAALCLAVLAPHRTSLDASGSMLYWEYRQGRARPVELVEWGGERGGTGGDRAPRLLAAMAALHARLGALSWARVLQPAVQLARDGYNVSQGLAAALAARGETRPAGSVRTAPLLARYLARLQQNSSAELAAAWGAAAALRRQSAASTAAGRWRVWAGGAAAAPVSRALAAALQSAPPGEPDAARDIAVAALRAEAGERPWSASSVASGLAVVDRLDTYAALVTGVSRPFGSGEESAGGWRADEPGATPLDLAPAILTEELVCGTRFVVGAESAAALAQAGSALATEGAPAAVERPRVPVWGNTSAAAAAAEVGAGAAVNVVRQRGDALASHADSRGGGHASRF